MASPMIQIKCAISEISYYIFCVRQILYKPSKGQRRHRHPLCNIVLHSTQRLRFLGSREMAASSKQDDNFESSFIDNFCCTICNEILKDPVQCQANEHYFCIECITKHLQNFKTCPVCADELTVETLRPAPKIIANVVSQMKKPRCSYVSRGCKEDVKLEELLLQQKTCDFAPVVCSHEGCETIVNRRDKEGHESEVCMYRMTTCESCSKEMIYSEYEKHQCTLRKEMNEMKACLTDINAALMQIMAKQIETQAKLEEYDKAFKTIEDPLRYTSSAAIQRENIVVVGQIFVFGSHDAATNKSIEVFNWATKTWSLVENCLNYGRQWSFSFFYGKKIMIGGGEIEYINRTENGYTSTVFPTSCSMNGILYGDRIITFQGQYVQERTLEPPYSARLVNVTLRPLFPESLPQLQPVIVPRPGEQRAGEQRRGVQRVGDRIYVVGRSTSSVEVYDVAHNEMTTLRAIPYTVTCMATVAYKDSLIIIGGDDGNKALNNVHMYNIHSLEYKPLPSMREARSGCAAVVKGDVIVVMGGSSGNIQYNMYTGQSYLPTKLKSVEYYVIGDSEWHELPAMNYQREGATAIVYV